MKTWKVSDSMNATMFGEAEVGRLVFVICRSKVSFQEHTGRVFRLQFDEFQIVSSSHDDTILIWDFLNPRVEGVFSDGSAASESSRRSQLSFAPLASSSPINNMRPPLDEDPSENGKVLRFSVVCLCGNLL